MRITFLVPTAYDLGGTAGAVATQTGFLCPRHDVTVLSVHRDRGEPHFDFDARVTLTDLVDLREGHERTADLTPEQVRDLRDRPTRLVDPAVDPQMDALADIGLEVALPVLEADVLVTVTPALLDVATRLAPPHVAVVHQEHRSSSQRRTGRGVLLQAAARADAVAVLVEPMAEWLRHELGWSAPPVLAVPNALPPMHRPRSPLTSPVILAAGRIASEKRYPDLVAAFAQVADRLPSWRLRILGDGPRRAGILAAVRRHALWDRVELPGPTDDLASEWVRASVSALTSVTEGYPLVVQEAMAAGVPVVAYDCPSGPREIIDDGIDGLLVPAGSVDAMAEGLLRLATDGDERGRLGAAARAASSRWAPEIIAPIWEEIYADAARRRAIRPSPSSGRVTALHVGHEAHTSGPSDHQDVAPPDREGHGTTPAEARREALAVACDVAAEVAPSGSWWVLPPRTDAQPTVVLPGTARRAFLAALARTDRDGDMPAYLSVRDPAERGWPGVRGTAAELMGLLTRGRTPRLRIEPWPRRGPHASLIGEGCGVTVEFWAEGVDGDLHGPVDEGDRSPRRSTPHPPLGRLTIHELDTPVPEASVLPTVDVCTFPIDLVCVATPGLPTATLRWSMRSVHLFAPWVRHLYVALTGDPPSWLDVGHERVRLVGPGEIVDLPALSEHLILLGHGVLLGRPRRPEHFFTAGGSTALLQPTSGPDAPVSALTHEVMRDAHGRQAVAPGHAGPVALRRSRLIEASDLLDRHAGIDGVDRPASPQVLSEVAQQLGLLAGTAYRTAGRHDVVDLAGADLTSRLTALLERDRDSVTLERAGTVDQSRSSVAALLDETLLQLLPIAAAWER